MVLQEEQTVASPASPTTSSYSSCEDGGLRRLGIGRERERERERERDIWEK